MGRMRHNGKVNIGILGAGDISNKFADACKRVEKANLIAVAARSGKRAEAFAKKHEIERSYGSYMDMMNDPDVEAVYIGVVNTGHMELIEMAAGAGKAIFCEKPALMDYGHMKRFNEVIEYSNVLFMEGVWTLHLPAIRKAKEWIEQGRIGRLCMSDITFCFEADPEVKPRVFDKELYGGGLVDVGVYCIAVMIMMTGSYPTDIQAMEYMGVESEVDEYGVALLRFPRNVIGTVNYGVGVARNQKSVLFGENGHIELTDFWDCQKIERYNKENELMETFTSKHENGFVYELQHFCELYLEGLMESDVNTIANTLEYVEIYEKIRKCR